MIFVIAVVTLLYAVKVYSTLPAGAVANRATEEEAKKHRLFQIANGKASSGEKD
jgi:hypothetical protein